MPIMLRPNNKSRQIAARVMMLAQRYGSDLDTLDVKDIPIQRSPLSKKSKKKFKSVGDFGSFIGADTGK